MIANLQKTKLLQKLLLAKLQSGAFPNLEDALQEAEDLLQDRAFGAPLARLRAAVPGLPIGGKDGGDLARTFTEIQEDLETLYEALLTLSARGVDLYDIWSVRRDLISLKLSQLEVQAGTMLAQAARGARASAFDSFNTLEFVDLDRSNVYIDLDEGVATLKPDPTRSVSYDGRRIQVRSVQLPAGSVQPGLPFSAAFSPYRAESWYVQLPAAGGEVVAEISVTGADYEAGDRAEVEVNALTIQPTGPMKLTVRWSPDGFNWHDLAPSVNLEITDQRTFHFQPILAGFLQFRMQPTGLTNGVLPVVGVKRIELMARGYNLETSLYSQEWRFDEPVHTVVAELEAEIPYGSQIDAYISQSYDGPWIKIGSGPVALGTVITPPAVDLTQFTKESETSRFYYALVPDQYVLPDSGELWAGDHQVELSAFPYPWSQELDRDHLPQAEDWETPRGVVRRGVFSARGDFGDADATADGFVADRNPLAFEVNGGETYGVIAVTQSDGQFALQPGYNYRLRFHLNLPAPKTLEGQKIGVINPQADGGTSSAIVAPHSLYLNGEKVYERQDSVLTLSDLTESYQATLPLQQGWNVVELYVQIPLDLETRREDPGSGVASGAITLYFQPDPFTMADPEIEECRAYGQPWKKVSEFDLRYNVAPGVNDVWAWQLDPESNAVENVLFNHNPANPVSGDLEYDAEAGFRTIDGQNAPRASHLELKYTVERTDLTVDPRSLYFRADLSKTDGSEAPPRLASYRMLIN